jgi:translation initiation factor SUI1
MESASISQSWRRTRNINVSHVCLCLLTPLKCTEFCCNGNVVDDKELGQVIQLQGDQRKNVSTFLVGNKLAKKDLIKIHGF